MLKVIIKTSLIILIFALLNSCNITMAKADHVMLYVKGESFTISWEDDSLKMANNPNKAEKFKIYYRQHGSPSWQFLTEIKAETDPQLTITDRMLKFGIYDLGVSSVNISGVESSIHSSLDMTAEPFCGWYINWIGSK